MNSRAWAMIVVTLVIVGTLGFLIGAMVLNIRRERRKGRSFWREFGLGLVLTILFFTSWIGHGFSEWQVYAAEQRLHDQPVEVRDFIFEFSQSTLENWQSEFLQLFSFVLLAALYVYKGSAESKDSDERMEASLRRLEEHLGTLPADAPRGEKDRWKLPDTPEQVAG